MQVLPHAHPRVQTRQHACSFGAFGSVDGAGAVAGGLSFFGLAEAGPERLSTNMRESRDLMKAGGNW
jgi:hypothetical protein